MEYVLTIVFCFVCSSDSTGERVVQRKDNTLLLWKVFIYFYYLFIFFYLKCQMTFVVKL